MAKVQYQVAGGVIKEESASTVADLKSKVGADGYTATVNGEPENDSYELNDFEFVTFAKAVKAGI